MIHSTVANTLLAVRYGNGYGRSHGMEHNLAVRLIWGQDCVGSNPAIPAVLSQMTRTSVA